MAEEMTLQAALGELRWPDRVRAMVAEARAANADRRARVLRYPDLAARLAKELGYDSAGQWNGYVPPKSDDHQRNLSPRRAALVAICQEAMRRDTTQEGTSS